MSRPRRFAFPAAYIGLLLPVLVDSGAVVRASVIVGSASLAIFSNRGVAFRIATLLLLAIGSLLPLLLVVQGSACRVGEPAANLLNCISERAGEVMLNAALLGAAVMLAVANEWRGTLLAAVNGLYLPRSVRLVAIVAGAMGGEFQRAASRVHQAFTGRGEALPGLSWRNALALPGMLAATWAAVLNGAAARLREQWGSDAFWSQYVPSGPERLGVITNRDALVIFWCGAVAATAILLAVAAH
jgi:hypothetical protein